MSDDLLALDWTRGTDATLSCAVSWHGESGHLLLELDGPGPATLSLVGARGVLWTRPIERSALR